MQKTPQIVALENKLDNLVQNFDSQNDVFLKSHLARYLIILTAGYFEQAIQNSLTQYARLRSHASIVNYVDATLAWEGSINRSKLERILARFDQSWFSAVEAAASDPEKNAVDSVKALRDQLAHGLDNGTGYAVAKTYHSLVRNYINHLLSVVP